MILFALVSRLALISPCVSPVQMTGPQGPAVMKSLKARSVDGRMPTSCTPIRIHAAFNGKNIVLLRDGHAPKMLPDVSTAALLIETWTRPDLLDPLLAARPGLTEVAIRPPPARHVNLDLAWVMAACERGDAWTGIQAGGCMQFGYLCPGLAIQGVMDTVPIDDRDDPGQARLRLSMLAMTDVVIGRARIGLGGGATAMRVPQPNGQDIVMGAPLIAGRSGYTIPLWKQLALDLTVATDLALWPRRHDGRERNREYQNPSHWLFSGAVGLRWVMQ
ncbi:MAG: hypothetical protein VX589_07825 [Myxococcota bacterium]|nr:hypothetical protein [Myxococcota bacterium]